MSRPHLSAAMRRRVAAWANHCCSYCQTQARIVGSALEIDHIVPLSANGSSVQSNLCLACSNCNQAKGSKTEGIDPNSDERVPLFNPRTQNWHNHFQWSEDGTTIIGKTASGRATVSALNMNQELVVKARRRWAAVGWHPPKI